jgi:hypothetical protein
MSGTVINWTREKAQSLQEAYNDAVARRDTEFTWTEMNGNGFMARKIADHPMHTAYAKHLLDYLAEQFLKTPDQPKRPYNEGEEGQ